MSFLTTRTLIIRAAASIDCSRLSWAHFQCCYSTKARKASDIIRWNTENKFLFGSKQRTTKKKAPEKEMAKGTRKVLQTDRGASPKEKAGKGKKTGKKQIDMKAASVSQGASSVDFSETDKSNEWWDERTALTDKNERDMFQEESALYDKLLASGKAYEGSEVSSASWETQNTNSVEIPELLPIPQGKDRQDAAGTASSSAKQKSSKVSNTISSSVKKKSSTMSSTISTANFKGVDFIQQCPLFPSQMEEVRSSAEEFHSFVDSLSLRFLPTVNVVLNKTRTELSNFFLQRWRQKMIQELGEEGFKKHQEATIWQGTNLHACVQQYLSGVPLVDIQVQESNRGHWESISSVLPDVTEVQALETDVSHPWLRYKGTFDCVAKYKNMLYVIDWKTSSKPKPLLSNLYDNPLQVAAYLGAINLTPDLTDKFGVIEQAAVVVAYANGEAAHVHRIQPALCQHYWKEWCLRLHQYWSAVATERGIETK